MGLKNLPTIFCSTGRKKTGECCADADGCSGNLIVGRGCGYGVEPGPAQRNACRWNPIATQLHIRPTLGRIGGLPSGCRIMAITSASQAEDEGSIPFTRSSFYLVSRIWLNTNRNIPSLWWPG